jgi:hypothetical protein
MTTSIRRSAPALKTWRLPSKRQLDERKVERKEATREGRRRLLQNNPPDILGGTGATFRGGVMMSRTGTTLVVVTTTATPLGSEQEEVGDRTSRR